MADQRQKIISSVFSRRNATGNLEESYVAHIKIWEDAGPEGGGRKPRYILLSQASNGSGFIHKSKLNTNGTFSVGKTWRLSELRAVHVVNPLAFNITLSRTYYWQTENQADQSIFLDALVRLFRVVAKGSPLQLEGLFVSEGDTKQLTSQKGLVLAERAPSPVGLPPTSRDRSSQLLRPYASSQVDQEDKTRPQLNTPTHRSQQQTDTLPRSASPESNRNYPSNITLPINSTPSRTRPPSTAGQIQSATHFRHVRQPSNATPTVNTVPPMNLPPRSPRLPPMQARLVDKNPNLVNVNPRDDPFPATSPYPPSPLRSRPPSPTPFSPPHKQPSQQDVSSSTSDSQIPRRDQNARISLYDYANQATLDRLITGERGIQSDVDGEDENILATMSNVEEMIEGYEWASDDIIGRRTSRGAAELIEARLLDELMALEKANIHSFIESDDRIGILLRYMDEAISELDNMDSLVSSYKIHLNTVSDDISYIQSQNRGLQVQTQNQRSLLNELENLLQTVKVSQEALITLTQESLEKPKSMQRLEEAAAELYKALQAGRETDMAATMERLHEYRTHNSQFCKRIFDFLSIAFVAQSTLVLGDNSGVLSASGRNKLTVLQHQEMELYLGRYSGLILYLKEMDEGIYAKLCAAYFSAASELHGTQIKAMLSNYLNFIKRAPDDGHEQSFSAIPVTGISKGAAGMRRAGTIIRSPIESRQKDKDKNPDGDLRAAEAFGLILEQLASLIYHEDEFITDFLQINDTALTFADYMDLDSYFRRQAARTAGLGQSTVKLVRGAMELIFGFLPTELKTWLDSALAKDNMEVIGALASLERFLVDAEERSNQFLFNLLGKQHTRLKGIFDRHVNTQIQDIEKTKLSSKKRQGTAHFVKYFPSYVGRAENQLIGADGLEIRTSVDTAYEKIVETIFESLKQMARMEGEGEDKGQLNYHIILIENMHYFVTETTQMGVGSITVFSKRAEAIYDENLSAYIKIILRRPFARIIDYFDGIERLLETIVPSEITNNALYSKSALRKTVKEYNTKEMRKQVEALFTRVAKHFAESSGKSTMEDNGVITPGTVMIKVWKACEEELLRMTERFSKRISQCYGDSGVTLEYTTTDVETAFRRHRVGP